ncbi:MAG: LL-diaminopimelate aminotransferase, partial [Anaerolinea sp.]|nr:LL-diaminopimelate aminotransferase [Anaerolinea sp.]
QGETDSIQFCDRLLQETGVSTTPGVVYGKHGEGYVRISLGTETDRIRQAMERVIAWYEKKQS